MKKLMQIAPVFLLAISCAACAGGAGTAPGLPVHASPLTAARHATYSCLSQPCIYVANYRNNSITIYARSANGNVPPVATITGPDTGLSGPVSVTLDTSHNIYVGNWDGGTITVYSAGATGDAAPIKTIGGTYTNISVPVYTALNPLGGLYVADYGGKVNYFGRNASGNVPPARTIEGSYTGITEAAVGIALYSHRRRASRSLYVTSMFNDAIVSYPAAANGNVSPTSSISGSYTSLNYPQGLAVVPRGMPGAGAIYVANSAANGGSGGVLVFPAGASGNVAPSATISGSYTGLNKPVGIALDSSKNIYVADENAVSVFAANSNGDVAPAQRIYGYYTGLDDPYGVAIQ